MKKTFVSLLLAGSLLSGVAVVNNANAQPPMQGNGMGYHQGGYGAKGFGYGYGFEYMKSQLSLNPQQVEEIEQLRSQQFENFAKNTSEFKMPMFDAIKSGQFNKQIFIDESLQNARLRAQQVANYMEKFFNILTPAQRQKFVGLQKQRMEFALKNAKLRQEMIQNRMNYLESNIQ